MSVPAPEPRLRVTAAISAADVPRLGPLPVALVRVPAGFPSPADDYIDKRLDLHELTGADAASCFFMRVEGQSLTGAGIHHGDVILVDRALEPASGAVVVACLDGELLLKRLVVRGRSARLLSEHPDYPPIIVTADQDLVIWGVVRWSFHDHMPRVRTLPRAAAA